MLSKISRTFFGLALTAIIAALLFSLVRKTNLAEQAGVVTYVCMTIGVILMVIDELRNQKDISRQVTTLKRKKKIKKRSV